MVYYCPHCWKEIPPGTDPCPHCGESTDEAGLTFVERLIRTLCHPEPTRAGLAIDILAERLREPRAVEPLIELMSTSKDAAILRQAARGLGLLGDRRAARPLATILANLETPLVVSIEAALALGRLGGDAAATALRAAFDDRRPSVSRAAQQGLAALRQPEAE